MKRSLANWTLSGRGRNYFGVGQPFQAAGEPGFSARRPSGGWKAALTGRLESPPYDMSSNLCPRALMLLALIALLAAGANIFGEGVTKPKEIAIGDPAPPFVLKDQNDLEFSLGTLTRNGPVAVVFIRSIDWCSYCQLQTVQLSQNLPKFQAAGGQVVMICYDAPEKVKRFAKRRKINVPILSDPDSKTIDAYAMRARIGAGDQVGSAQHGTFVIDKSGIVRSKPYLTSFEGDAAIDALVGALKDAAGDRR